MSFINKIKLFSAYPVVDELGQISQLNLVDLRGVAAFEVGEEGIGRCVSFFSFFLFDFHRLILLLFFFLFTLHFNTIGDSRHNFSNSVHCSTI